MKFRLAVVLATCVAIGQSGFAASNVVISQVYGGGGNAGATYKNDFIELHNRTNAPLSVSGWSVQYASSAGTTWQVTNLSGSIPAGGYYLIQESQGAGGTTNLPTPDAIGTIMMSASGAKVALVSNTTALSGGCPAGVIDLVGYDGANCFEGAGAAPTLTNTTAAIRANNGCTDTDNNASDFASGAPNPRNSAALAFTCSNNPPTITPPADPIKIVDQDAPPFTVSVSGKDDFSVYNWSATAGTGLSTVSVSAGQGTATVTFNVTLQSGFSGIATFTASLSDNVNAPVTQAVNIAVTPPPDHIVISQIYGGGGNFGATYKNDYVQLHNPTNSSVDISGWSLQYASAAGSSWTNNQPLGGVIGPNEHYLIALASGRSTALDLPAADISGSINMSALTGTIALVRNG